MELVIGCSSKSRYGFGQGCLVLLTFHVSNITSLVAITESSIPAARLFILFKYIRKMVRIWMVYIQAISVGAVVKKLF